MDANFCILLKNEKLTFGWIEKAEKNKLFVVPEQGAALKISLSDALLLWREPVQSKEQAIEHLNQKRANIKRQLSEQKLDLASLYELLEKETPYLFAELADLFFSTEQQNDPWNLIRLYLELYDETYLFRFRKGSFLARSAENIEIVKRDQLKKQTEQLEKAKEASWMAALQQDAVSFAPAEEDQASFQKFLQRLEKFSFYLEDDLERDYFYSFFKKDEHSPYALEYKISKILQAQGRGSSWGTLRIRKSSMADPEPLELQQEVAACLTLYQDFTDLAAAEQANPALADLKDQRALPAFTVDNETTLDYDDAISFIEQGDERKLICHVSAVSLFIPFPSALFSWAEKRISSLYTPKEVYSMFPKALADGLFALIAGKTRPVVSFAFSFNAEHQLIDQSCSLAWIKVEKNLSYQEFDQVLAKAEGGWSFYWQCLIELEKKRLANGARKVERKEVFLDISQPDAIAIEGYREEMPASFFIQELAIQTNQFAGDYFSRHNLTALFRAQEPPETRTYEPSPNLAFPVSSTIFKGVQIRTTAKPHASLGLEAYSQVTSPIRRFSDLVSQRVLIDALCSRDNPFLPKHFEYWIPRIEKLSRDHHELERELVLHWKLKYLIQHRLDTFHGLFQRFLYGDLALVRIDELDLLTEIRIKKVLEQPLFEVTIEEIDLAHHYVRFAIKT